MQQILIGEFIDGVEIMFGAGTYKYIELDEDSLTDNASTQAYFQG
jgi:hypothetical protein